MNDIHHLTGAYALDAVDDIERARFELHLADCDDCSTEVLSLREAAFLLSETSVSLPPPSLRSAVLRDITKVRPLPPIVTRTPVVQRRWFPLLVAAALAAILGVGATVWQPWAPTQEASLSAADQVMGANDAVSVEVDLGESGRAVITRSVSLGKAVITTEDMVDAPSGKVFALWLQSPEGQMLAAGLMPAGANNQVMLTGDAATATGAGITVEPAGGSVEPTSDPIAVFDFSQAT